MLRFLFACLLFVSTTAGAQIPEWEREMLPLQFATVSPELREHLTTTWSAGRVERHFCVTHWSIGKTQDGDTVFVALRLREQEVKATALAIHEPPDCRDEQGKHLPTAHTHLLGDCSPSRADIRDAIARKPEFDLILCGPGITAGYVWSNHFRPPID